ncbi:MAG: HNH endonuclease [Bdellovibrionales bacterium]|nr:HNH endonuclease [Bdellovibrionales bacterium]
MIVTIDEIERQMRAALSDERRATNRVLVLINLAEARKLHLERGFSSLFDWLVHGLGYAQSSAYRRIEAARLLRDVPQAAAKLETGELNLSTMAKAKSAIRAKEKRSGRKMSKEEQAEVVSKVENKTIFEAEQTLVTMFPEISDDVYQERKTVISADQIRLSFNISAEGFKDLEWVKNYLSHAEPKGDTGKIFARLLKEFRARIEKQGQRATSAMEKAPENERRATAKKVSLHRVQRRCEYKDETTGKVCGTSFQVEVDHIRPRAMGGEDRLKNYRCLCRAHNQLVAEQKLGQYRVNRWRSRRSTHRQDGS